MWFTLDIINASVYETFLHDFAYKNVLLVISGLYGSVMLLIGILAQLVSSANRMNAMPCYCHCLVCILTEDVATAVHAVLI